MKIFISAVAISFFSLVASSCTRHSSCPAYSDSMEKGINIDNTTVNQENLPENKNM